MTIFESVLIPGGGLTPEGSLPPWTIARLEHALKYKEQCRLFILLSGGTVHKPPPMDEEGFPIFESRKGAEYLVNAGLEPAQILTEICSYDTIGNAYFSRLLFAEPLRLKRLLIITSEFHMTRTKAIFEWVYKLPPAQLDFQLSFENSPNSVISSQVLAARLLREKNSLDNLKITQQEIRNLEEFHTWLYSDHKAYAAAKTTEPLSEDELKSY